LNFRAEGEHRRRGVTRDNDDDVPLAGLSGGKHCGRRHDLPVRAVERPASIFSIAILPKISVEVNNSYDRSGRRARRVECSDQFETIAAHSSNTHLLNTHHYQLKYAVQQDD
jgi:hypothetical protein